jgi:hypothetical protein
MSDLQEPGAEHAGEDEADPYEREFDPDAEQEQGHTQLGEILDGVGRRYPGEPSRSCEQPSQEIGDDRRKPEPAADEEAAGGDCEQDEDFGRSHAPVPLSRSSLTLEAPIVRPGRCLSHQDGSAVMDQRFSVCGGLGPRATIITRAAPAMRSAELETRPGERL